MWSSDRIAELPFYMDQGAPHAWRTVRAGGALLAASDRHRAPRVPRQGGVSSHAGKDGEDHSGPLVPVLQLAPVLIPGVANEPDIDQGQRPPVTTR